MFTLELLHFEFFFCHYLPRMHYRQKPEYFLFTKYVHKISAGSMMESILVWTVDKNRTSVRI